MPTSVSGHSDANERQHLTFSRTQVRNGEHERLQCLFKMTMVDIILQLDTNRTCTMAEITHRWIIPPPGYTLIVPHCR